MRSLQASSCRTTPRLDDRSKQNLREACTRAHVELRCERIIGQRDDQGVDCIQAYPELCYDLMIVLGEIYEMFAHELVSNIATATDS